MIIYTNSTALNEKKYVFDQVFSNFLSVGYRVSIDDSLSTINIEISGFKIILNSDFFNQFKNLEWLSKKTMPLLPLKRLENRYEFLDKNIQNLPILYGKNSLELGKDKITIGIDVFGSIFFMLSRYEELVVKEKDNHSRFPYKESISFKEDFIMRPIVDEYIMLLWSCIRHLCPTIERKQHKINTFISCDVDFIEDEGVRFPGIFKRVAGDLIKRKSIKSLFNSIWIFFQVSVLNKKKLDPYNCFDFMMDVCEENKLKMAFYFIPRNNKNAIDGDYDIDSLEVIKIMKNIIKRGHEVGFHASYYSYKDKDKTRQELELLCSVYKKSGGNICDLKGGRQHYLRWETGYTEKNWENINLVYDTTLGYAEHIGYRCGTSREYNFYDSLNRVPLNLKIRPLLVMDVSLLDDKYMALKYEESIAIVEKIYSSIQMYKGNFTLLWHNSSLNSFEEKKCFKKLVGLKPE
ncbi:hypothetical protein JM80_0730 [Cellulophaga sp. RHA_52]|uniref:polysaccharide deacetylase family protein n=1 Tax=Cellulophaga sp. RHA_52 TaxID=1250036 RepID=UPI00119C4D72|nr:polysaccharide deacetylase family protein [Cellulophaga sp. RHA_52]TVZ08246.1 hypothetical protein JM80_0730 [Cellulophaga sp. RHA_52]